MYFKESTNSSRILTSDYTEKFYLRDQRVKPLKKRDLPTNESRISSQSSIYGNNVTLEDSIEKSLDPLKHYKQDSVIEKGHYPPNHVHIQAEGKLKCACTICMAQNMMKAEPEDPFTDPFFANLQNGLSDHVVSLERGFVFVLRKLMPPKHIAHGLSIKIPETLVYIDGEAKFFALTGKDKTLKFMSQREKLAMHEIRKFFNDRFALKDEEQRVSESRNTLDTKTVVLTTEIATERTQGIDLRKGTPSSQLSLGIGKSSRHKTTRSLKMKIPPVNREVALIKFNDDSTTILCEAEFENIVTKKKFDPYWRNIAFIQNYRGFSKFIHTLQRVYFIYDREKNNPLFLRAAIEVHQLIKDIPISSDSYIPAFEEENFQKNLRNHNESDYCMYIIMKVFHFIELVHGYRIIKMCGEFVKDTNDVLWLTNVTHLQYQNKTAPAKGFDENHGKVRSMFDLDTVERSTTNESLHEIRRKDDANVLSELMQKQYDNLKRGINIKEPTPSYQEDISDNIFTQLYPNAPYRLSLLLKANSKPNHINNPKNIVSDTSFRVGSTRRTLEDERQPSVPIKGVYLGMTKNVPSQNALMSNNTSGNGNQSNRSIMKSRAVKLRGESHENLSKASRTPIPSMPSLPSLGNIDGYTNVSIAMEPKKQAQKSDNGKSATGRSNSQPNMKKTFKFYGLNPGVTNVINQYPKIPNDMFKDAAHARILQRTPSELISQVPKITKMTTVEGDVYTERCTPVADRSRNSGPNTPYTKGLRGLSRETQGKLVVQLDQGPNSRRSQSVNKRALGYILNN